MKKLGLTLVTIMAFSTSVFATGASSENSQKWNGSINTTCLNKYLQLKASQNDEVENICEHFEQEMKLANNAKKNKEEKLRKAIYGNLKLMKSTLDEKQHNNYVRVMGATLRNKGISLY